MKNLKKSCSKLVSWRAEIFSQPDFDGMRHLNADFWKHLKLASSQTTTIPFEILQKVTV